MTANECEFEQEGFCNPPKEYAEFVCPSSKTIDGLTYCHGDNNMLMTEEEWEAQQMEEKSRMNRDDREMKGYQRK
jgi:hypothetical protein